ncbi:MAG TPA: hypothetical protein VEF04_10590, partial [Blastocatellia bacterium]|nr:hypothetical protein [Blastocatellia bacterium]
MRSTQYSPKMLSYLIAGLSLMLAGTLSGFAQTPVPAATPKPLPRSDNQIWNETQLYVPLNKRVGLNVLQFARGGNNVSLRTDTRTGL